MKRKRKRRIAEIAAGKRLGDGHDEMALRSEKRGWLHVLMPKAKG
jgi:hypothetical protein